MRMFALVFALRRLLRRHCTEEGMRMFALVFALRRLLRRHLVATEGFAATDSLHWRRQIPVSAGCSAPGTRHREPGLHAGDVVKALLLLHRHCPAIVVATVGQLMNRLVPSWADLPVGHDGFDAILVL